MKCKLLMSYFSIGLILPDIDLDYSTCSNWSNYNGTLSSNFRLSQGVHLVLDELKVLRLSDEDPGL